jgi:hypothetical protein
MRLCGDLPGNPPRGADHDAQTAYNGQTHSRQTAVKDDLGMPRFSAHRRKTSSKRGMTGQTEKYGMVGKTSSALYRRSHLVIIGQLTDWSDTNNQARSV